MFAGVRVQAGDGDARRREAEARKLASTVPLDARLASDKAFNDAFKDKPEVKSRLETEWDTTAKSNYGKAIDRAEQAARMR